MKFQPEYALSGRSPLMLETVNQVERLMDEGRARPGYSDQNAISVRHWQRLILARSGSMIPPGRCCQHLIIWKTAAQGIGRTHGLRHAYAQRRYLELTGWAAPALAGIRKLTPDERLKDQEARKIVAGIRAWPHCDYQCLFGFVEGREIMSFDFDRAAAIAAPPMR